MARSVGDLVRAGECVLTIYSPDAIAGGLEGNLDQHIADRTGLLPIYRKWILHDAASIEDFYRLSVGNNVPHWHLVSQLFTTGPALLTLWKGARAIACLSELKGASHPSNAAPDTIRSRFWCDNAICNLLHVSDNPAEVERELSAVGEVDILFSRESRVVDLLAARPSPGARMAHSGIFAFVAYLHRAILSGAIHLAAPRPTDDGDAYENWSIADRHLRDIGHVATPVAHAAIRAYRCGDLVEFKKAARTLDPMMPWEQFVMECGAARNELWIRAAVRKAAEAIEELTESDQGWALEGSAARALLGLSQAPNDVDIWVAEAQLHAIAAKASAPVEHHVDGAAAFNRVQVKRPDFDLEFIGDKLYNSRLVIRFDRSTEARIHVVDGVPLVCPEDQIAELLLHNRPAPKGDAEQAEDLRHALASTLDQELLTARATELGLPMLPD